ncbi:MAG: protein-(glutamine-N5) methyltransferase, release factor-specific [Bacteroidetes bacterium]|nr:MAG: protein-(glutamine-N5) methyltransferase, release factor-specific [Bacteroidota bacterium]
MNRIGGVRGKGPWPSTNDEIAVRKWLESKMSKGVELEERHSVVLLCLEWVSGKGRGERLMNSYKFPESKIDKLAIIGDRLALGEPIQYILEEAHFDGLDLYVDSRVLIPRPETEELISAFEQKLKLLTGVSKCRVLDIGTGSGCIPIALKHRMPNLTLFASDFSEDAIEVAKKNSTKTGCDVFFECSDILKDAPFNRGEHKIKRFDAVISNPPYIPHCELNSMERRVVDFEPNSALFVPDDDPLLFYKRIIYLCDEGMLKKGGWLALECHEDFVNDVVNVLESRNPNWINIEIIFDLQGKPRHVLAQIDLT